MTDRGILLPGSDPVRRAEIHDAIEREKSFHLKYREVELRQDNIENPLRDDIEYYRNRWGRSP